MKSLYLLVLWAPLMMGQAVLGGQCKALLDLAHDANSLMCVAGKWELVAPEPIDVPAITKSKCHKEPYGTWPECEIVSKTFTTVYMPAGKECERHGGKLLIDQDVCVDKPSCADKSRVLMHSEDGKFWCHKVQAAEGK